MKVTVEKKEGNKIHLEIEVDGQGIKEEYENVLKGQSRHFKIKGFRKGKIPLHLVEKYIDSDKVKREIFERAMSWSYQQALAEHQIESIAEPSVQAVHAEIGQAFVYKAIVEVRPDVVLGQYKGLSVNVPPKEEFNEDKLNAELETLQRQHAVLLPVDDRGAQLGDVVTVHIEGSIEGETIDLGESKDMTIELKEDSFVKGFSAEIVGLEVDAKKEFDLTFPEDYYIEDLRGKEIHFSVHVQEIKEVELPELDDDFALTLGEYESLEDLKTQKREEIEELLEDQHEITKQQLVLDKVVNLATVDVPDSMLSREMMAMWQMSEGQQLMNAKVNENTLRASLAHWLQRPEMKTTAEQRIKTTLVLGAIAREENIVITQEEVDEEIQEIAETHDVPVEQVKKQLEQENRMVSLMDELLSFKIIDWVMDNNEMVIDDDFEAKREAEKAEAEKAKAAATDASEATEEVAEAVSEAEASPDSSEEEKVEQSV